MYNEPMLNSRLQLPVEPAVILKALQDAGYEAYIVGGAVRDLLLAPDGDLRTQPERLDFDFTTNARPEEIIAVFPEAFYENQFGTVMITPEDLRAQFGLPEPSDTQAEEAAQSPKRIIDLAKATKIHISLEVPEASADPEKKEKQERNFEITTYRSEGAYSDHRRPDFVDWGESIEEDLERRDFTINALALKINAEALEKIAERKETDLLQLDPSEYEIVDLHGGVEDLKQKIIRTVGNPGDRFREDALRMLRAIRLSVQLNCKIDEITYEAIIKNSDLITKISFERISAEFLKMLASRFPKEAVEMLDETGLLVHIIPELLEGKGVEQGGHHTTDVWTHSLDALAACPSTDPIVRLATLIHDIAKPRTYADSDGKITFYNHEIIGSRMAKKIAERLRLSRQDQERIFILVRYHMFYYQPENTDASIRRFMRKVGLNNIDDILDLREGDRLGSGARRTSWRLEEMKARMVEQLHQPMEIRDLAINGHDLMRELGMQPGPELGRVLNELFELVLDDPQLNQKEILLEKAKELVV